MSLLYAKSILAIFFIAAGLVAVLCMFALMGRSEQKVSPRVLSITHKVAGVRPPDVALHMRSLTPMWLVCRLAGQQVAQIHDGSHNSIQNPNIITTIPISKHIDNFRKT